MHTEQVQGSAEGQQQSFPVAGEGIEGTYRFVDALSLFGVQLI
jgi:hypothetical protein